MSKYDNNLVVIPDSRINDAYTFMPIASVFCDNCNSLLDNLKCYPYGYDPNDNEIVYVSICPHCGEIMFTRD